MSSIAFIGKTLGEEGNLCNKEDDVKWLPTNMLRSRKFFSTILLAVCIVVLFCVYGLHSSTQYQILYDNSLTLKIGRNLENVEAEEPQEPAQTLNELLNCHDKTVTQRYGQRGDFWVLYNYVPARKWFGCAESITYTTHGDHTFLGNLETLLSRWQGPISISIFAPGTDFDIAMQSIEYVRHCSKKAELIQDLVTFHIYFPNKHIPKNIPKVNGIQHLTKIKYDCSKPAPWVKKPSVTYRTSKKLLYPVNVGRNIAREEAVTHFVLASDIELYPNPGLIPEFLNMIKNDLELSIRKYDSLTRKVYVLSIFEVKANMSLPRNKTVLLNMLKKSDAVPFHTYICSKCHAEPNAEEWINMTQAPQLQISHVGHRIGQFYHWEPIYIGTHAEPMYEERLSWEGQKDKMTQGYAMCVLNYDFCILNNAFLVHKPGIKYPKKDAKRAVHVKRTNQLIQRTILPEMISLYGARKGCSV